MKAARIVVLAVAVVAGGTAFLLAGRSDKAPKPHAQAPAVATVDVLVAKADIPMGHKLTPGDMQWQAWPPSAANANFITKASRPTAIDQLSGSIARAPFVTGEPIREAKLVKADGSGYMAAILPSGMRAVSTQISAETGAGGFILPNDHVDVLLTRRAQGDEKANSEIILKNIRVLAIDQTVEEKNGQKVVVGKTATLELTPHQSETLTLAHQLGTISLALRSITDVNAKTASNDEEDDNQRRGNVSIVRFGVGNTAK
ncbi:MAG: Flp pilus assembly protein RcpC/CpaB [Pseudolabrys sp.]|jgi:pilus assembly protein CpaB|nr:Flp pilus assembly protein RcpC/CpaB [Pseudolabrys sp.]